MRIFICSTAQEPCKMVMMIRTIICTIHKRKHLSLILHCVAFALFEVFMNWEYGVHPVFCLLKRIWYKDADILVSQTIKHKKERNLFLMWVPKISGFWQRRARLHVGGGGCCIFHAIWHKRSRHNFNINFEEFWGYDDKWGTWSNWSYRPWKSQVKAFIVHCCSLLCFSACVDSRLLWFVYTS